MIGILGLESDIHRLYFPIGHVAEVSGETEGRSCPVRLFTVVCLTKNKLEVIRKTVPKVM